MTNRGIDRKAAGATVFAEPAASNLGELALEIAALDHPNVDLAPYRAHLTALGADLKSALMHMEPASAVAFTLAVKAGYSGDRDDYDDPANADLIRVIDRRRGLPVALGLIYLDAAARAGLPMAGLGFPGHFLVRIESAPHQIIDPFNDGAVVDQPGLNRLLRSVGGTPLDLPPSHWQAARPRDVLLRLLNNIKTRAQKAGDDARAAEILTRMTGLAPDDAALWFERAMADAAVGHMSAAAGALGTCLALDPAPGLADLARDKLDLLRRSLN